MKRALFLDRDGTINANPPWGGYVWRFSDFRLLNGVERSLRRFRDAGFDFIVVTNQSGITKGLFSHEDIQRLHEQAAELLAGRGIEIADFYCCPHTRDFDCECRKPKPGMLFRAAEEHGIDLASSLMVGDSAKDVEAGKRAGTRTAFLWGNAFPGQCMKALAYRPDYVARDLPSLYALLSERETAMLH